MGGGGVADKVRAAARWLPFSANEEGSAAGAAVQLRVRRARGTQGLGKPSIFPARSVSCLAFHTRIG